MKSHDHIRVNLFANSKGRRRVDSERWQRTCLVVNSLKFEGNSKPEVGTFEPIYFAIWSSPPFPSVRRLGLLPVRDSGPVGPSPSRRTRTNSRELGACLPARVNEP